MNHGTTTGYRNGCRCRSCKDANARYARERRLRHNGPPPTPEERFWRKVDQRGADECWPWLGSTTRGYGHARLGDRVQRAHRLAYELTHGELPSGLYVLHHCDNPPCCNPAHLYLGTQAQNVRDRETRQRSGGVKMRGESNPSARLTWEQVEYIRDRIRAGQRGVQAELARELGVGTATISRIARGSHWKAPS